MFKRIDSNGDGVISEEEFRNAKPMHEGMRHNGRVPPAGADG
jgi:hypothetical protein